MWIIPKTLSAFVPATPGWSLESSELAWMFAQSVTWRSKFMSKQYWLKRFKKGDYVQHLSGVTLSPSMHDHFVESWTESQEASHVSHFQAPENEKDKKTQGTYSQASQTLFDFADPDGSSSKTCQDWLPLGCVTSCKTWDKWVIERRSAYSVRKKLALHTKGNESSSWPTPRAGNPGSRKPGTGGKILAEEAKKHNGLQDLEKSNTSGKNHGSWPTPRVGGHEKAETSIKRGRGVSLTGAVAKDATQTPKLNPNWVEQLMGLSTGWTDLGSWGMELSPKPQN